MKKIYPFLAILFLFIVQSCSKEQPLTAVEVISEELLLKDAAAQYIHIFPYSYEQKLPKYLEAIGYQTREVDDKKVALGRVLFYDKNLSSDRTISCASCHKQELAFGDDAVFSQGVEGRRSTRHSMALGNVALFDAHYTSFDFKAAPGLLWDGRAANVGNQAPMAFTNPHEMNMTMDGVVDRVKEMPYYPYFFSNAYGDQDVTASRITDCIQAFVGSMGAANSKLDVALEGVGGNLNVSVSTKQTIINSYEGSDTVNSLVIPLKNFTTGEMRGKDIFIAKCTKCHSPLRPVQEVFMACNGLDTEYADNGLGALTGRAADNGVFKSPSLRNIELTAPYMHDGRFKTLEEVVDFYSTGIQPHANLHPMFITPSDGVVRMNFTTEQKANLVAFLKTFTDPNIQTNVRFSNPFIQ